MKPGNPALEAAPTWRSQPYRILFPLGLLLAWAGVLHWPFFAIDPTNHYRSVFHSIAQIQGFLMAFATGFLFTMVPRRTGTAPPSALQMWIAILCPVLTTAFAWFDAFAESQMPWLVLLATLGTFVMKRFHSGAARRKPPQAFVWVPLALLMGLVGTVLLGLYGAASAKGPEGLGALEVHEFGRALLLQGLFLGLIVGVGSMVLPLMTTGRTPPDASESTRRDLLWHLPAALLLVFSFFQETWHPEVLRSFLPEVLIGRSPAYLLRAALILVLLIRFARIHEPPSKPGAHRWLIWISAWALPLGYLIGGLVGPGSYQAGLHLVFIAGFSLMALSVGLHVTLAHGGRPDLVARPGPLAPVFGLLMLVAVLLRAGLSLTETPSHTRIYLGSSAALYLLATLLWLRLLLKGMVAEEK